MYEKLIIAFHLYEMIHRRYIKKILNEKDDRRECKHYKSLRWGYWIVSNLSSMVQITIMKNWHYHEKFCSFFLFQFLFRYNVESSRKNLKHTSLRQGRLVFFSSETWKKFQITFGLCFSFFQKVVFFKQKE